MKIPTQIQLLGHLIEVKFDNEYCKENKVYGSASYNETSIILCDEYDGVKLSEYFILQTYFHELTHFILYYMNEHKINNEKFVDMYASLLAQSIMTSTYGKQDVNI